jgi:hypothetical protein
MYRYLALLLMLGVVGCHPEQATDRKLGTVLPALSPPNPVYIVDNTTGSSANLIGNASNPIYVVGGAAADGGTSATPTAVDTAPGDLLNSVADQIALSLQGQVKTSAGTFETVNYCNEGIVTGWLMFFDHGGSAPDAGSVAGQTPKLMGERTPAGACGSRSGARAFTNGIFWYSSGQPGTLDAGLAPSFTTETFYR